jgi:acyl-homoserine lactone acylase PvdQ
MSGIGARLTSVVACAVMALATQAAVATAASAPDFASPGEAFNVLPPGQEFGFVPPPTARDQIPLYDGLTPKFDDVTAADLPNFFKPNVFGLAGRPPRRTETVPSRPGLKIERDDHGVPHVSADTRADVMFGAGYVAAEDRLILMDLLRGPGRIAALDVPGLDPFSLALSFQPFNSTQETEDFLAAQVEVLRAQGAEGDQVIADVDHYLEGINTFRTLAGSSGRPWNRNDVVAVASLIGAVFGKGGGDEARRSQFLAALQQRLGASAGLEVWRDLREEQDPETWVSVDGFFPLPGQPVRCTHGGKHGKFKEKDKAGKGNGKAKGHEKWTSCISPPPGEGNVVLDPGSLDTSAARASAASRAASRPASNAVLVGAQRSSTGHPFFVAGPQVGYFYPNVLFETDLHGGGIDARGATFPGAGPYVQLGRGQDYSWSATSAGSDVIDHYVERLCGDDTHYLHSGDCREMTTFNAGTLGFGAGQPVVFKETVHGPVIGYATVGGERVAIAQKRSTRGREVASATGFADLNENDLDSPEEFFRATAKIDFTFNWFYADHKDIAMYSSGRVPVRDARVRLGLPTKGTGEYEWEGFVPTARHPHGTNPSAGVIVNWNNKPARGWPAADDTWSYGPVHRNNLLEDAINRRAEHSLASTVAAMNRAATQDLRATHGIRAVIRVLDTGPAPTQRAARMLELLKDWRAQGSSRLDRDLDGRIDHPGAAIIDAAWRRIADAVMSPVLGPQLGDLASLIPRDQPPSPQGSAFITGWYGYVDKDLRTQLGLPVKGKFGTRYCGRGDFPECRRSLWAALDAAGTELTAAQGADPDAWRADATPERIQFAPGFLPNTMRWTNRPTFQQAISYSGHR